MLLWLLVPLKVTNGLRTSNKTKRQWNPTIRIFNRFKEKTGYTLCSEIHKIRYGKIYRLFNPEERQAFYETGGRIKRGCPEVRGIAAQIAAEAILDIKKNF